MTDRSLFMTRRTVLGAIAAAAIAGSAKASDLRTIREGRTMRPRTRAEFDERHTSQAEHEYIGLWVTADGQIRHDLLPGGRYVEARGQRESAYRGRYVVTGRFIDYVDDTGFLADGEFIDGVLHHAGMILRRNGRTPTAG
jgi:hypothetical protein